ncbi:phosphoenolpyruvate carboxylase [Gracilimonas mengyeensis]|uniref:Phosphoenolpyruvate carboxylase n=1 Tax=Gracilimonas mengyeensis TaxID=1302730 RepID=A0A521C5B4_9BACT|nr:phosphoenolpyruvate carboxylase [Gracilimonas mengyeensis]SMO54608.1 Phosphoenolpyruvate carboxylase, type 1 [Gracilimonas mengyeensis]
MYFSTTDDGIELGKIQDDLTFLHRCYVDMLRELGEDQVAEAIEDGKHSKSDSEKISKAFSLYFQLITIVEENAAVQLRRKLEDEYGLDRISGLWGKILSELRDHKLSEEDILDKLPQTRVEPVLTAHPTESKRSTVIDQLRYIYLLMVKRENQMWTHNEEQQIRDEIMTAMQRLWNTGQVFLHKPSISDELRNVMHYLTNVFPQVLPMLDQRLRDAWESAGFNPDLLNDYRQFPKISFGNWVGGDRDGHPFVTDQVTSDTLLKLRRQALQLLREDLSSLAQKISISSLEVDVPEILKKRITGMALRCEEDAEAAISRNVDEPWRQYLNLMQLLLPLDEEGQPIEDLEKTRYYLSKDEVLADLDIFIKSLEEINAHRIVKMDVEPVARKAETFGFHLAALDIRQNSKFHDAALASLLKAAGIEDGENFADWPEEKRVEFLNEELKTSRPFVRHRYGLSNESDAVLACYRVIYKHIKRFGPAGIGSFIVSMTRSLSDLLVVYILCREAGLMEQTDEGMACRVPVVPLLETIEDLEDGPEILDRFLAHPVTQRSMRYREQKDGADRCQQVMVGYSDSNKDGGIFASLWSLHQAQKKLSDVGESHDIRIRFFHGRGGTISRGAGPTHRFIAGLPSSTIKGDLRLTEQGEMISQKYANTVTALYNMELLQAGTAGLTLGVNDSSQKKLHEELEPIINKVYDYSLESYQKMVHSDDFVRFFAQATPIDVIESSRIGSRPARRTGKRSFGDLRAIPWVFSWSQARFFLTGWYGVGSALQRLKKEDEEAFELLSKHAIDYMPFRYIISNASSAIALTDTEIMERYASLVDDEELADSYLKQIKEEFTRTREMLEVLYGHKLTARRPRLYRMIAFRSERLEPLHDLQIQQLKKWRKMKEDGKEKEAAELLPDMLLVLNAIASGLGTTG